MMQTARCHLLASVKKSHPKRKRKMCGVVPPQDEFFVLAKQYMSDTEFGPEHFSDHAKNSVLYSKNR